MKILAVLLFLSSVSHAQTFESIIDAHNSCISYIRKTNPNIPYKSLCYCLVDWQRAKVSMSNFKAFDICKDFAKSSGKPSPMWKDYNIGISTEELVKVKQSFLFAFWNFTKNKRIVSGDTVIKAMNCIGNLILNSKKRSMINVKIPKTEYKKCLKLMRYFPNHFGSRKISI